MQKKRLIFSLGSLQLRKLICFLSTEVAINGATEADGTRPEEEVFSTFSTGVRGMAKPRKMVAVVSLSLLLAVLAAPAQGAAPPKHAAECEGAVSLLPSAAAETLSMVLSTALLSPRAQLKKTPPPPNPLPIVVRPPEPPPPPPPPPPIDSPPELTEIPEPGTLLTAVIGGSLAGWTVWRRRRMRPTEPTPSE
jgi:hypothetical protein